MDQIKALLPLNDINLTNFVAIITKFFPIVIIIIMGWLLLRAIHYILSALKAKNRLPPTMISTLGTIVRWAVILIIALLALGELGMSISMLWTLLDAFVLASGLIFFSTYSVLTNISCAFLLFIIHPFRIGDQIELLDIGGVSYLRGRVIDIKLVFTSIKESEGQSAKSNVLKVPNCVFFQKTVRVFSE